MQSGNAVMSLCLANTNPLNACTNTAQLFHGAISLGSTPITALAATGTAVQQQASIAVTGFTYVDGERLRLALT